uniref:Uncharacterized protein n=1 Tax=Romanomermis culicivorax TaxID=13658 RepID=A0A915HNI7_ROMCU
MDAATLHKKIIINEGIDLDFLEEGAFGHWEFDKRDPEFKLIFSQYKMLFHKAQMIQKTFTHGVKKEASLGKELIIDRMRKWLNFKGAESRRRNPRYIRMDQHLSIAKANFVRQLALVQFLLAVIHARNKLPESFENLWCIMVRRFHNPQGRNLLAKYEPTPSMLCEQDAGRASPSMFAEQKYEPGLRQMIYITNSSAWFNGPIICPLKYADHIESYLENIDHTAYLLFSIQNGINVVATVIVIKKGELSRKGNDKQNVPLIQ